MKIYAFSGLGVDSRLFKYLDINCELIPIEWIPPFTDEPLDSYINRISKPIHTDEDFGILGVSFGGLIATEISKVLQPKFTILISSAETKDELRPIYGWIGSIGLVNWIPKTWFKIPKFPATYLFGTKNKALLYPILDDTDPHFAKWAINVLVNWKNTTRLNKVLKLSGGNDKLIPTSNHQNTIILPKEGHFIIADRAKDISKYINTYISNF